MTRSQLAWLKAGVIIASLVPLAQLTARAFGFGSLGANPVQLLQQTLGITALNLLLITLAITPLRRVTGRNWLVQLRRSVGLLAFFYALLHALSYAALDLRFDWPRLATDVVERPWITVGFAALLLLVPLAVTSTNRMQRRLGRRWKTLHRSVYAIGALGVLHFFWQVKLDTREPLVYATMLFVLLGFRLVDSVRRRVRRRAVQ